MISKVFNFKRIIILCCIAITLSFTINSQIASSWTAKNGTEYDSHGMITYHGYQSAKDRWGRTGCISFFVDWKHPQCVGFIFVPMIVLYILAFALDGFPPTKPLGRLALAIATHMHGYVSSMERWIILQGLLIDAVFRSTDDITWTRSYHMEGNGAGNRNQLEDIRGYAKDDKLYTIFLALPFIFNDMALVKQLHRVQDFYSHTFFAYFVVKHYDDNPGAFGGTDPRGMGYYQLKENALTKVAYQSILENDVYFSGCSYVRDNFSASEQAALGLPKLGDIDDHWNNGSGQVGSLKYYREYAVTMAEDITGYLLYWAYRPGFSTWASIE